MSRKSEWMSLVCLQKFICLFKHVNISFFSYTARISCGAFLQTKTTTHAIRVVSIAHEHVTLYLHHVRIICQSNYGKIDAACEHLLHIN